MSQFFVRNMPVKPLVVVVLLLLSGAVVTQPACAVTDVGYSPSPRAMATYDGELLEWEWDGVSWRHPDPVTGGFSFSGSFPDLLLLPGLSGGSSEAYGTGDVLASGGKGAIGSTGGVGGDAKATATGNNAYAKAIGGLGGAGVIGREIELPGNALATALGGVGNVSAEAFGNSVEATAYGEGNRVSAFGYGKNGVVRASGINQTQDITVIATLKGTDGSDEQYSFYSDNFLLPFGFYNNHDIDGSDSIITDTVSGGAGGTLFLVQNAWAGVGGEPKLDALGNVIGFPGHAGNASSSLSGQNSLGGDIFLESNAAGGWGGGSEDLGQDGGSANATAYSVDSGNIVVHATATGGDGGNSNSFFVGWGGTAKLGRVYGASTGGGTVLVSGQATGGAGGDGLWNDLNRSGGWGRSVHIENAVDGDTTGALTLRQLAYGGAAGRDASSGKSPRTYGAGSASSSLSKTTANDALDVESHAYVPGGGGDATAKATGINTEGSAIATSSAEGCTEFVSMYDCTSGSTEASAKARGMDKAKARASALGSESGFVYADAGSYVGTGKTLSVRAYAGAEMPKNTTNTSTSGQELSNMRATAAAGVFIAPSNVSDIDGTDDKHAAAYVVTEPGDLVALIPEVDSFFATGAVGAIGRIKAYNDGHSLSSAHIDLSFDLTDLNLIPDLSIPATNQHLMLMFLNPISYGSGAVDGLNLSIDVAGQNVFSKSTSDTDDAAAFLSGGVLDLADLADGWAILPTNKSWQVIDQKLDVSMQLSLVAASDWGGLSFDFALGMRASGSADPTLPISTDSTDTIFIDLRPSVNFPREGYALYGLPAPPETVPLPPSIWLMVSGIAVLFGLRGRKHHKELS